MSQTTTQRYSSQGAPGFMTSPPQERETESLCLPFTALSFLLTLAGDDPSIAGAYTTTFPTPSGGSVTATYTTAGGAALALEGPLLAAAYNIDPLFSKYFVAVAVGAVITVTAVSPSLNIALADIVTSVPGATTLTASALTAAGGLTLPMGVIYKFGPVAVGPAVTGTMRQARPAAPLEVGDTLPTLRGLVGRVANQTTLAPDFDETAPDAYTSPGIFPGELRGEGYVNVTPESGVLTIATTPVYVVLAVGTQTQVGALTDTADGGNTLQVDTGDYLRLLGGESTPSFGTPQRRIIHCKISRNN